MSALHAHSSTRARRGHRPFALAAGLAAGVLAAGAQGFEIDTGQPDWRLRWDQQLRYALGVRGEKVNDDFGNSPTFDETERKFGRGDVMMNRVDLLSEADLVWRSRYGLRLSAAAWYDAAYSNGRAEGNPAFAGFGNYDGGRYSSTTRRYARGASGEILDAFVFANHDFGGGRSLALKLGQHTVYWGETLFQGFHGIAYSQAPLDGLKAAASPGIEAKEVFMPVSQLSASYSFSPEWSLRGQYFLAWRPNRLPQGGTYFGAADMLFDGPDTMVVGATPEGAPIVVPRTASVEPTRHAGNNWGLNLRWSPAALDATTFGLYYRRFDETQPWAPVISVGPGFAPDGYHLAYAKDTEMLALSVSTALGPTSFGLDLSYRRHTALVSTPVFAAVGDLEGVEGARGNTWHLVANVFYLLPASSLWQTGTLAAELAYSRLDRVTRNEALYLGVGRDACTTPTGARGGKRDGCATKDVLVAQVNFAPQWLQVAPSLDLTLPLTLSWGLHGNGATLGGGNEGAHAYSVGLELLYQQKYVLKLQWADAHADYRDTAAGPSPNGNAVQNNHGWFSVSFKTSF